MCHWDHLALCFVIMLLTRYTDKKHVQHLSHQCDQTNWTNSSQLSAPISDTKKVTSSWCPPFRSWRVAPWPLTKLNPSLVGFNLSNKTRVRPRRPSQNQTWHPEASDWILSNLLFAEFRKSHVTIAVFIFWCFLSNNSALFWWPVSDILLAFAGWIHPHQNSKRHQKTQSIHRCPSNVSQGTLDFVSWF